MTDRSGEQASAGAHRGPHPLLTFAASIIVALAGGGLAGAVTSYFQNQEKITADRQQSIDEFRRAQQRDQYSAILQQATRLANAADFSISAAAAGMLSFSPTLSDKNIYSPPDTKSDPSTGPFTGPQYSGGPFTATEYYAQNFGISNTNHYNNPYSGGSWQDAYTALDQAISNAAIAANTKTLDYARALRDKYRDNYFQRVMQNIESIRRSYPDPKPDPTVLANALVGVPKATPTLAELVLLNKTVDELTAGFTTSAASDLHLN
ncbi:hypothetical protein [Mycolicibacterium aromaticivorans]|uniref:hypothetical protein n=1 Tax=Mycolicibacterium aromaticivorans TaxID=318425 RepID=UPI00103DAA36|nr:hypothetical protein [Mycolicibacterium aromaticivorans]